MRNENVASEPEKGVPATTLPEIKKAEISPQFSAGFQSKNNTPIPPVISPYRRRTLKRAKKIIAEGGIRGRALTEALESVRLARQPVASAKRIVECHKKKKLALDVGDEVDLSDVQEVRVKLIRRDGGIWPPQSTLLGKMERRILTEGMTPEAFKDSAAVVVGMKQALPASFLKQEAA